MGWVDAPAAAEHLDLSVKTVLVLARGKKIPASKVGGSWRFDLDAIDAHLAQPSDPWVQSPHSRSRRRVA